MSTNDDGRTVVTQPSRDLPDWVLNEMRRVDAATWSILAKHSSRRNGTSTTAQPQHADPGDTGDAATSPAARPRLSEAAAEALDRLYERCAAKQAAIDGASQKGA